MFFFVFYISRFIHKLYSNMIKKLLNICNTYFDIYIDVFYSCVLLTNLRDKVVIRYTV